MPLINLIFLLFIGAFGILLRYIFLISFANQFLAIMIINILGCFLAGLFSLIAKDHHWLLFLSVGFVGSFTTFSTYVLQIMDLAHIDFLRMIFYFVLSNGLSLMSAYLGLFVARLFA